MHLTLIVEVEVLAHVRRRTVSFPACFERVPEGVVIAAYSLEGVRRGVIDLLVEERVLPWPSNRSGHGGMVGQAVGRIGCLLVPVPALGDQPGPEVREGIV